MSKNLRIVIYLEKIKAAVILKTLSRRIKVSKGEKEAAIECM